MAWEFFFFGIHGNAPLSPAEWFGWEIGQLLEDQKHETRGPRQLPIILFIPSNIIQLYIYIYIYIYILAGGLEHFFMTFHILGMSSSQLTNSYFSEG